MNERIKQLAEQAGEYVNEVYTPPVRSKTPGKIWEDGHIEWHTHFNQKFAELIVMECIDCARGAGLADDVAVKNGLGFNDGISEAVTHMKKHFGVEK